MSVEDVAEWLAGQGYVVAPPSRIKQTGQQLREKVAEAISRYDWDHGVSANPEVGSHQRGEADAVMTVVQPQLDRLLESQRSLLEEREEQIARAVRAETAIGRSRELVEQAVRDILKAPPETLPRRVLASAERLMAALGGRLAGETSGAQDSSQ